MATHPHTHLAGSRAVRVHVVTVSTSRTAGTDVSGPLIRELVAHAGHVVDAHTLVPDDPGAIAQAIETLLGRVEVEAIVLTGGTGISARDCTPAVLRGLLDRELPGFGELFRMLSWQQVGSAAMLSSAIGGVARGRPVFALPGSPEACRLAMEKLILPELGHLVAEVAKETPLATSRQAPVAPVQKVDHQGEAPPAPVPEGVSITATGAGARPEEQEIASGWKAGLRGLQGEIKRNTMGEIPETLERYAAVMDVLNAAGERAVVALPGGVEYAAFGYPDLQRNASKVLLVREAEPWGEIVALHRWPRRVGLCAAVEDGVLPSADLDPGPVAALRTGVPYQGSGQLFAVENASVYVTDGKRVSQWDGRNLAGAEPVGTVLASLLLHWSQR
ncbi:MAG: MogA/MoaB family molybdenum cofactor biosynthesis protein [Myxococcota bacterium]